MKRSFVAHVCAAAAIVAVTLIFAAPASAQIGTVKGKVVDEKGNPVPAADLVFEFQGELTIRFTGKTDAKGEYTRAGLSTTGEWRVIAKKDALSGSATNISVSSGNATTVPAIVLKAGTATDNIDAKQRAEIQKYMGDVDAALKVNDYGTAITKLGEVATRVEACVPCYMQMGDAYMKKAATESGDAQKASYDGAETAYKKAIEVNPKAADAYDMLATYYNRQRRLDEAAQMSMKAAEIRSASGAAMDPTSAFNAGVIFWNASKIAEAKAQFQKAIELQPTMAEAHYYLGMCLINEGKIPEAKAALGQYLKLAPTGANAPTAQAVIDSLPK